MGELASFGYDERDYEVAWVTADGALLWWEVDNLELVRRCREVFEQQQMERDLELERMEKYWKFIRYLVENGQLEP